MTENLSHLLSPEAVRARCALVGQAADKQRTKWFSLDRSALPDCIDQVSAECIRNYPDLDIPYHSRWRHFVVEKTDLWQIYHDKHLSNMSPASVTRSAIDLVFVSVLLDAGAGDQWKYLDPVSGELLSRSEGLAAASLELFFTRLAKAEPSGEVSLSAQSLRQCSEQSLTTIFQHHSNNPLIGIPGRTKLLNGLADALDQHRHENFHRPGNLYDRICARFPERSLDAGELLKMVLNLFNGMWPDGMVREGVHLGDCGEHTLLGSAEKNGSIVPFHKLSQWITYSLLEPLQWAGIKITNLDQLTGLPEYRNGGLLLDTGVLKLNDSSLAETALDVASETVVEWRALTVWLLDQIAEGVREKLGKTTNTLPLASVLQGGTWSTGRKLATELRGGLPPLKLDIRGTVF